MGEYITQNLTPETVKGQTTLFCPFNEKIVHLVYRITEEISPFNDA